ncbi:MAG: alcohol dehydrogenase [Verrucomicrobiales bacterium VVV1]|nr:MAG: alcohol dehydrogenase [Verrucomicrobiales bacterium VVV1]
MNHLVFHQTGNPAEVLSLEPFELPSLNEGEVRLRLLAAPINPADLNTIEGSYGVKLTLPATPGIEGVGEVIESRDPSFASGDHAIFLRRSATWATHAQVSGDTLFKLPVMVDPLQAAMLKVNPATAWRLLTGFQQPEPGHWIVQNASNSGVGRCVIQLAKTLGIRTMNLVRRPELVAELTALGADQVVTDDDEGLARAKDLLGKERAKLAFNAVGGDSALRLMNLLDEGGIHITYGAMGRRPLTIPNGLLIFKDLQFRGLWVSRWIENAPRAEVAEVYGFLASEVAAGRLQQPVDSTFALEDFTEAITRSMQSGRDGKVLFVP